MGPVWLALFVVLALVAAQPNVTLSKTFFSDAFRVKATGMKVRETAAPLRCATLAHGPAGVAAAHRTAV